MFPPRPGQCAYVIDGAHTEFLVTEYTDRLFIVVTQIGKLGTVFHLSRSQTAELSRALAVDGVNDLADDALSSMDAVVARTLIGRRDDETLRACARRIGEVLFSKDTKSARVDARDGTFYFISTTTNASANSVTDGR